MKTTNHLSSSLVAMVAGLAIVMVMLVFPPLAAAESPNDLIEDLNDSGVFVAAVRNDVDADAIAEAIQEIRFDGLRIVVVAPIDPQPGGEAFARRIQEAVDADAAMVFLVDGSITTYVIDDLTTARVRATSEAEGIDDPAQAVRVFAAELVADRDPSRPELVGRLTAVVVVFTVIIGVVVGTEQSIAATKRRRRQAAAAGANDG